ncbi:MAG TPA: YfbK domain-containing protein, partial [Flavisolibacter sp.]|nr:YfbK domain-containing protein [Flavisolibacter sp.]
LTPGGNTPGESGIKLAYNLARKHFIEKGNNRVILATDGDFNVGLRSEADLEKLIEEQSSTGVYLTCLGVGMGNYKDSKIQVLAKKGRGNFAYLDSYAEGEKVMMKEFMQTLYVVADDAYLHVQFDPEQVKEYRLIGFDNKMGAIKDTLALIEGGSIGSAYSMIVTFEITPNNTAAAKIGSASLARFSLSYKAPSEAYTRSEVIQPQLNYTPLNKLERSYQFATSVMMFGSILKESRIAKNISFNDVSLLAAQSANMELPSQKEFLSLVQQAKSIYSKKKKIGLGQIGFRN